MSVYDEIRMERNRQDEQWGGRAHDDKHLSDDWLSYIECQLDRVEFYDGEEPDANYRQRLIKIAAIAIAAVESLDRLKAK